MQKSLNDYLDRHSSLPDEVLDWLEKQTNIHTNFPRMLSGRNQGEFLKLLVEISGARRILEIGAFTGYSTICLASGLPEDGHLDTLEINDELEDLMREGWERAGLSGRISLHLGDAVRSLEALNATPPETLYDLVFIDANKREYCRYYELVMPLLKSGGLVIADDVLWDGKVYQDPPPSDAQTTGLLDFNRMVAEDPRVEQVILPIRDGISIIRKKTAL